MRNLWDLLPQDNDLKFCEVLTLALSFQRACSGLVTDQLTHDHVEPASLSLEGWGSQA